MLESTERNSLDVINFTNVSNSDYEGMWGGEITIIKAGETKPFPRFLAYHYAKHLIDKMLLRGGGDYGDEVLRKPLEERILGTVSIPTELPTPATPVPETPPEPIIGEAVTPGEEKGEEGFVGVPVEVLQEKEIEVQEKEPKPKKRGKK